MGNGLAVKLPLFYDPVDGPYTLLKTMREVGAQNLKMLVLTNPGERIMNPDFGVGPPHAFNFKVSALFLPEIDFFEVELF